MTETPYLAAAAALPPVRPNLPEFSVSELSAALKRSIEQTFAVTSAPFQDRHADTASHLLKARTPREIEGPFRSRPITVAIGGADKRLARRGDESGAADSRPLDIKSVPIGWACAGFQRGATLLRTAHCRCGMLRRIRGSRKRQRFDCVEHWIASERPYESAEGAKLQSGDELFRT